MKTCELCFVLTAVFLCLAHVQEVFASNRQKNVKPKAQESWWASVVYPERVRTHTPYFLFSSVFLIDKKYKKVAAAVRLLGKGADRHLRDHEGRTAMDWANRFGSTRLLDVLLFDPNNVKIFLIARERDVRGVLALMEQGVDPNTTCPERNYTPLIAAVFNQVGTAGSSRGRTARRRGWGLAWLGLALALARA